MSLPDSPASNSLVWIGLGGAMEASLCVPFAQSRHARAAFNALRVDPEPKRSGVKRELGVQEAGSDGGAALEVKFHASDPRALRVSLNSFLDLLSLVVDTIHKFDA